MLQRAEYVCMSIYSIHVRRIHNQGFSSAFPSSNTIENADSSSKLLEAHSKSMYVLYMYIANVPAHHHPFILMREIRKEQRTKAEYQIGMSVGIHEPGS